MFSQNYNNKILRWMKHAFLLALLLIIVCSQSPVTWNLDSTIQTGSYNVVVGSTPQGTLNASELNYQPVYIYTVTYSSALASVPTAACIGVNNLKFDGSPDSLIFFGNLIYQVSSTSATIKASYNGTSTIITLRVSVMVCMENSNAFLKLRITTLDPTNPTVLSLFSNLNSGSGYRAATIIFTRSKPLDTSHTNYELLLISAFSIKPSSTDGRAEIGVDMTSINTTDYQVTYWTSGDCKAYWVDYTYILFDQTVAEADQMTFIDAGYIAAQDGNQTTFSSMVAQKQDNFIVGFNYFRLNLTNVQRDFDISIAYPNIVTTLSNYSILNFTYFNCRVRSCPAAEPYYLKSSQLCYAACPDGTYPPTVAYYCSSCDSKCATCNAIPACLTCNASQNRQLNTSTNLCDCKAGYFDNSTQICIACSSGCLTCTSTSVCTTCNTSTGVYLDNSNQCLPCDYSCNTCNTTTTCLGCSSSDHRTYNSSTQSCDCDPMFYDNGASVCGSCGTGCLICNSTDCQQCDAGYNLSSTSPYKCTLNNPSKSLNFSIISVIKQPSSNNITYSLKLDSMPPELIGTDLSKVFSFGLPNSSVVTVEYDEKTGLLVARAAYFQNLQSMDVNITLNLKNSGLAIFSQASSVTQQKTILSPNNLAANYYPQEVYDRIPALDGLVKTFLAISLATVLLGLYAGKVVVTEMVGVIQLAAIGLTLVQYGNPLMWPFRYLRYAHGFNISGSQYQQGLPTELAWLDYYNSLSNNLNLMLLLSLMTLLAALTFLVLHRIVKLEAQKERIWGFFSLSVGEYLFTAVIFCLYQFFVSLPVFIKYSQQTGRMFAASIVQIVLYVSVIAGVLVLYVLRDHAYFGEFKTSFHPDRFCQLYYLVPVIERIVIGLLLGACRDPLVAGILTIAILIASLILIAVKRPYIKNKDNARALANYVVNVIVIVIYVALQYTNQLQSSIYLPYAIIVLLLFITLTSLGFLIMKIVFKIRQTNEAKTRQQTSNLFTIESLEGSNAGEAKPPPQVSIEHTKQEQPRVEVKDEPEGELQMPFEMPMRRKKRRKRGSLSTLVPRHQEDNSLANLQLSDSAVEKVEVLQEL